MWARASRSCRSLVGTAAPGCSAEQRSAFLTVISIGRAWPNGRRGLSPRGFRFCTSGTLAPTWDKKRAPEPGNSCGRRKRITQPRGFGEKIRLQTLDPPRLAEVRGPTPFTADCPEQPRPEERYRLLCAIASSGRPALRASCRNPSAGRRSARS